MHPMSTSAALDFLSHGSRTGKLAWIAADGRPHVAPVWFIVEDGDLLFATGTRSGKALAMAREPRVSLVVDTEAPPYAFVKVDGVVEISQDARGASARVHAGRRPLHGRG